MKEAPVPQQIPLPAFIKRSHNRFRWSLGITVFVLLGQVVFFVGVAAYNLSLIDWSGDRAVALASPETAILFEQAIVLLPFAGLGFISIIACLLRPRLGWHMAMLAQSGILLIALQVYLSDRNNVLTQRPLLYLYMLGAILIVVFMNSPEGRLLLGQRRRKHNT